MSGAALVGAAVVGAAASVYSANKSARAQKRASAQAERHARETAERQEQAVRRQNQNQADVSGILQQSQDAMLSGGSTLLTGAGGVQQPQNLGTQNKLG